MSSELWPSGYNGGLVIWRPCGVCGSNPTMDKIFCNVHLFRVPRMAAFKRNQAWHSSEVIGAWTEKDNFKSREAKRLKEFALTLSMFNIDIIAYTTHKTLIYLNLFFCVFNCCMISVISIWLRECRDVIFICRLPLCCRCRKGTGYILS